MANNNSPFGLRPARLSSGVRFGCNHYYLPASEANDLFIGDVITKAGDADANGIPTAVKATPGTGNRLTGAIVGFRPSPTLVANGYRKGGVAEYAIVCDDPSAIFEVQTTTLATADVGSNTNLVAGTGNRINQSRLGANGAQVATTNTYQLNILGLSRSEDNAVGAYAKILVRINQHTEVPASAGI